MLSRRDIEKELGKGINIYPVVRENFKENSINLTLSANAWSMGDGTVFWNGGNKFSLEETAEKKKPYRIDRKSAVAYTGNKRDNEKYKYVILLPHTTTIVETVEVIGVAENIGGALHSKVGLSAHGVGHIGTMLGPGYCGHLMVPLHNVTDELIILKVGTTFASLSFDYLTTQVIRTSATTSGHVDKFAELGITISEETRNFLTADWKSNIKGIRQKMCESEEFQKYRQQINDNRWEEIKKYLNKRNFIAVAIVLCVFVGLWSLASYVDNQSGNHIWVDRFWNVGCSGFVGSFMIALWNFLKDKK